MYTLSGNTAVYEGNSSEIYSNLGQGAYFEVPGGKTYFVNVAVADTDTASGTIYQVFPISGGSFTIPLQYTIAVAGSTVTVDAPSFTGPIVESTLTAAGGVLTGGYFKDPITNIVYTCVVDAGVTTFIDSNNTVYPYPAQGTTDILVANVVVATGVSVAVDNEAPADNLPDHQQPIHRRHVTKHHDVHGQRCSRIPERRDRAVSGRWSTDVSSFRRSRRSPTRPTRFAAATSSRAT